MRTKILGTERQFIKIILWCEDQLSQQLPMKACLCLLYTAVNKSCLSWGVLNTTRKNTRKNE